MKTLQAIGLLIAFLIVLLIVGTKGWEIILGFISLIILAAAYVVIRIIIEYPDDAP